MQDKKENKNMKFTEAEKTSGWVRGYRLKTTEEPEGFRDGRRGRRELCNVIAVIDAMRGRLTYQSTCITENKLGVSVVAGSLHGDACQPIRIEQHLE